MKRFFPGWGFIGQLLHEEPGGGGGGGGNGDPKDAAYWEGEAKKAFKARDDAKKALKELEESGRVLTPEQKQRLADLEAEAAKVEEERAKKAGEFETLKKTLTDKHSNELGERDKKISTLSDRFQRTVVRAEFGRATDLFGGHDQSKTVLDVDMAISVLGRYVTVEDDDKAADGYRIVVKNSDGEPILDGKGNPAKFTDAIAEVINALPNRDRILRGSGKAGSGANGEVPLDNGGRIDATKLTPDQRKDPKVIEALRKQRGTGGLVMGRAFSR